MTEPQNSKTLAEQLGHAFNARDLNAMEALLAPSATAEVLGSGFPVEEGPVKIGETSLAYLIAEEQGSLTAEPLRLEGGDYLLLRQAQGTRPIDSAIRVIGEAGQITRLEYLVIHFRLAELRQMAEGLGLPLAQADPA